VTRLRPILEDLEGALAEVDAARDQSRRVLRLTASETVTTLLVQTIVPTFLERYPEMSVDPVARPAFVDIVAEGFDAGFGLGEAVPLDMIAVHVGGPSHMLPVAAPSYLEARERPRTPDDLAKHVCISPAAEAAAGQRSWPGSWRCPNARSIAISRIWRRRGRLFRERRVSATCFAPACDLLRWKICNIHAGPFIDSWAPRIAVTTIHHMQSANTFLRRFEMLKHP
jgi:DNA-binding transcriptional LysR family regulator